VWKATLLSRIRAHEVAALILIILAALSSSIFVYAFTAVQGAPCPSDAKPFQDSTMPPGQFSSYLLRVEQAFAWRSRFLDSSPWVGWLLHQV